MPLSPDLISILIPTYNNGGTIVDVARRCLEIHPHVLVVVDGSTDQSADLLRKNVPEAKLLISPRNEGKGKALKKGFELLRNQGFRYAITLDGDSQHFPEDIPLFLEQISLHEGALLVGSRNLHSENMPSGNTFANKFSNFWFRLQTLKNLPDTQTGFRAYPLDRLPSLGLLTSRYEAELELLVFSAWKGVEIVPIPIRVYYPPEGERVSSFRPGLDFTRISILNTVLCILALVYGYPRMLLAWIGKHLKRGAR